MTPRIALVIGNGFSISFAHAVGVSEQWNSQHFFSWDVKSPTSDDKLIDLLPNLKKLKGFKSQSDENDFKVFEYLQDESFCTDNNICQKQCLIEARHYLTIAFSRLAIEQINSFDTSWSWFKWLQIHKENISCAYSLNYDLLLEKCFDELGIVYDSCQVNSHGLGLSLAKPHGSVDFEIQGIDIPIHYPLRGRCDLNDTPIKRLDLSQLQSPRIQPLCIVPNEKNKYLDFQWVLNSNQNFLDSLTKCTHCLFIGISYFPCDRPEIDLIIKHLPKDAEIIMGNPESNNDLLDKVSSYPVSYWKSYSGPIDDYGNLIMLKNLTTGKLLSKCFCKSGKAYKYCCAI